MENNALNDLVEYGKTDIRGLVADMLSEMAEEFDDGHAPGIAGKMFSLLALSVRKEPPAINVGEIRSLIVEENFGLLSGMTEYSSHVVQMFAIATGRVTQIAEYLVAIERIGPTLVEADRYLAGCFVILADALQEQKRLAVRMYLDERLGKPMLFDVRSSRHGEDAGQGLDGSPA